MSKFSKGNKAGRGRPPGSPNKITAQKKVFLEQVSDYLSENLINDIQELSASERVKLWLSIQEYLLPKLSRTEIKDEGENDTTIRINVVRPEPDLSKLTTEELKTLKALTEKINYFDEPITQED